MKKILTAVLAMVMVLSMGVTAFAATEDGQIDFGNTINATYGGEATVEFTYADDFDFNDYAASVKLGGQFVDKFSIKVLDAETNTATLTVKFKKLPLAYASAVEILVKATKSSGATITTSSGVAKFSVMDEAIGEDTIKAHVENKLTIDAAGALVITEDGFTAAGANPLSVNFGGFTVEFQKVTGQKGINFDSNTVSIDEITDKYKDNEFKFLSFTSTVKLANKATVVMGFTEYDEEAFGFKSDDENKTVYLYQYDGNQLISHGTVNMAAKGAEVAFTVKAGDTLGRYLVTNKAISGAVVNDSTSSSGSSSGNGAGESNPNTGAADLTGAAVTLAVISIVAAAAVSLKKSK